MTRWLRRLFGRAPAAQNAAPDAGPPCGNPLPVLVHAHPKDAVPPGPLEEGMVEIETEEVVLHAVAGALDEDGEPCDLLPHRLDWACRVSYEHLRREGLLEMFGIASVPELEYVEAALACDTLPSPGRPVPRFGHDPADLPGAGE